MDFRNVFLRDQNGAARRLFAFANEKDRKGEYYLKIILPDLKKIPLRTGVHDASGLITKRDIIPEGVQEFSYHYRSGVSHFKNNRTRVDEKKNGSHLAEFPALHMMRLVVWSLSPFKQFLDSQITNDDFVLPEPFVGKARGFELALSRTSGDWRVINSQGDDPVSTYKMSLNDLNISLHIADCKWKRAPIGNNDTIFKIFRYDNPEDNFEFKVDNRII